jgi:hypothetical protein
MKSNLCSVCDISRLQSSAGPSEARVSPDEVIDTSSAGPPQDRDDSPNVVMIDGVSIDIEDLVRVLDGQNVRAQSKDQIPSLEYNDVLSYISSLEKAYLNLPRSSDMPGYDSLSEPDYEKLRDELSKSHKTVSAWIKERMKGILFRRIHVFIRDKIGIVCIIIVYVLYHLIFYIYILPL